MRRFSHVILGLAASFALAGAASAASFDVFYGAPGAETTTATFTQSGVETFDSAPVGAGQTYTSTFGGSGFTGQYANLQVNSADQYGGAGGAGNYAVTFPGSYTLDLSTTVAGGVTYFGYWLSALDPGNQITFYSQGAEVFSFSAQDVLAAVDNLPNPSQYFGNPNANFQGQDGGEPFVFVDFFAKGGATFDQIVFSEVNYGGGYESDNQTVGHWLTEGTGTPVGGVPEPATWLMMLAGMGAVGAMLRTARNRPPQAAAQRFDRAGAA